MPFPTITDLTTDDELMAIHNLPVGSIINISGQLELALSRLEDTQPAGTLYVYIRPGTEQYALTGPNHVIKTTL